MTQGLPRKQEEAAGAIPVDQQARAAIVGAAYVVVGVEGAVVEVEVDVVAVEGVVAQVHCLK
jgi:hypothetical protein